MTNTEIIQAIKAEIERLKKEELTRNSIGVITGSAFFVSANELLSFLDTLESENPMNLDLEIEIEDTRLEFCDEVDGITVEIIAKRFYELGRNAK